VQREVWEFVINIQRMTETAKTLHLDVPKLLRQVEQARERIVAQAKTWVTPRT
jgi:hypothetical protein